MTKRLTFLILLTIALNGCRFGGQNGAPLAVSGGKSATVALENLSPKTAMPARPSGALGIFASIYLSQGLFISADAARQALDAIIRIVQPQEHPLTDLAGLLQTLGDTLSTDVVDLLNRSSDRLTTLDQFLTGLTNAIDNGDRKLTEINASLETLATQQKDRQRAVNDLIKAQKDALTAKDYTLAGEKEEELLRAQTLLSETMLTLQQTRDDRDRLKKLLDLAKARKSAIEENRELLLAGLKVTDIPGLTDLGLVKSASSSRSEGTSIFGF